MDDVIRDTDSDAENDIISFVNVFKANDILHILSAILIWLTSSCLTGCVLTACVISRTKNNK